MKGRIAAIALGVALCAPVANAAGYTAWSIPTQVEHVNGGLLIAGSFGDPHSCGMANYIFVAGTDSRFKEIVAMAYTALASGRELRFYSNTCTQVTAHWSGYVINENRGAQAAMMR